MQNDPRCIDLLKPIYLWHIVDQEGRLKKNQKQKRQGRKEEITNCTWTDDSDFALFRHDHDE